MIVSFAAVDGVPAFHLPKFYARANAISWFVTAELSTRAQRADEERRNALGGTLHFAHISVGEQNDQFPHVSNSSKTGKLAIM